jgi:uridylate kinase
MKLLIKLSGESLSNGKSSTHGQYDEPTLENIVGGIKLLQEKEHSIALVVGGGNLFRGNELTGKLAIERATADYVGMLATAQNALVLRDYFKSKGVATRVLSAISMPQICEGYIPKRAERHLDKGRVVIFAAGLGVPYFTTDSTAVQRALEMKMDLLIMAKNGVDGLYTAPPESDASATLIKEITASEVLKKNLKIADQAAIALAKEHKLAIKVIGVTDISRALDKEVGSTIKPE